MEKLNCLELCAGAGGQALGFERAGFDHVALVDNDAPACATLRRNRPDWTVIEGDLRAFDARPYRDKVDVLAAGLPCPPFSKAGHQRGAADDRDLFPEALRLVRELRPRALMIENVDAFRSGKFRTYWVKFRNRLRKRGYVVRRRVFDVADFGVPQHRKRLVIVALKAPYAKKFRWPKATVTEPVSVGAAIGTLMAAGGWLGAADWAMAARLPAPTIVGGSKRHGGADLGPTRTRAAWSAMGVEGKSLADGPPPPGFDGMPRLTNAMVARLQGFPPDWQFAGRKTAVYRQIGNALPPALAEAVANSLRLALTVEKKGDGTQMAEGRAAMQKSRRAATTVGRRGA